MYWGQGQGQGQGGGHPGPQVRSGPPYHNKPTYPKSIFHNLPKDLNTNISLSLISVILPSYSSTRLKMSLKWKLNYSPD